MRCLHVCLMSNTPSFSCSVANLKRWFVELPELGPSIKIVGFLGSGVTSHVYEASEGGQQVMSSIIAKWKC